MKFVPTSWCTRKWFRLYQTIRNLFFWRYGNPACDDSTGSDWIEKYQVHVTPRPVWASFGYVEVLFTCGECGFSSFGSWSCSEE